MIIGKINTKYILTLNAFITSLSIDLIFTYIILFNLIQNQNPLLSSIVLSFRFLGNTLLGPVIGHLTDKVRKSQSHLYHLFLCFLIILCWLFIRFEVQYILLFLLFLLSILSYFLGNLRIVLAKIFIPEEDVDQYHSILVLISNATILISPLITFAMLEIKNIEIYVGFIFTFAMAISTICVFYVVKGYRDLPNSLEIKLLNNIRYGIKYIKESDILLISVISAMVLNLVCIPIDIVLISKSIELNTGLGNLNTYLLVTSALGGILGASIKMTNIFRNVSDSSALSFCFIALITIIVPSIFIDSVYLIFLTAFLIGLVSAFCVSVIWSVRVKYSQKENIGIVSGITGSLYKLPALVSLPFIGYIIGTFSYKSILVMDILIMLSTIIFFKVRKKKEICQKTI